VREEAQRKRGRREAHIEAAAPKRDSAVSWD